MLDINLAAGEKTDYCFCIFQINLLQIWYVLMD